MMFTALAIPCKTGIGPGAEICPGPQFLPGMCRKIEEADWWRTLHGV